MAQNRNKIGYLTLVLTREWFDMIDSGEKKEEYRDLKPFYDRIFKTGNIRIKGIFYKPENVIIEFCHAYSPNRDKFMCHCLGLKRGYGEPKWGAKEGIECYVLSLGEPF